MTVAWMFPGQGSQQRGMGDGLLDAFPDLVERCGRIVGTDMRRLCLEDPDRALADTRWAQPALFLVNALTARKALEQQAPPDILLGHSLGEYNALEAAGVLDFDDAVALVDHRARLMGAAVGGGMAAVIGVAGVEAARTMLDAAGTPELEIANLNSATQMVVSGDRDAVKRFAAWARSSKAARVVPLAVSAAFHSSHMDEAAEEFDRALASVTLRDPDRPVVANVTARPYEPGEVRDVLARQMRSQVRWWDSLLHLRARGVTEAHQMGPGDVLAGFWTAALQETPAPAAERSPVPRRPAPVTANDEISARGRPFCVAHGVREPYMAGAMFRGIASPELVVRMGRAGLLGVYGTGGLDSAEIDRGLTWIREALGPEAPWAVNLLATPDHPGLEDARVDQYLEHGVHTVDAASFTQVTPAVVRYRFHGAHLADGRARAPHRLIAKVSRTEVAAQFLQPPSEALLAKVRADGALSDSEIAAARRLPVASDLCVEADSGGHTDGGVALALLPTMVRLRERYASADLDERVRLGAAGGIGSPESVAAAFVLGAEFVVTGSVNQCTPEGGTSDVVKDLLAQLDVGDTTYAPAGDMLEIGARVQVVRKGTLFPARANYLYQVYRSHDSLEDLRPGVRRTVERYLGCDVEQAWETARARLARDPTELARAERDPKVRMVRTFKNYFSRSVVAALDGDLEQRANFQIHSGPAIGALNADLAGTALHDWRTRHVDTIADHLLTGARKVLRAHR